MRSKLFRKTMLSYTAILAIPIVVFCAILYRQISRENQNALKTHYEERVYNLSGIMDRVFFDAASLGDRLLSTNWVKRIRSGSPIIGRYFDSIRMQDISQELLVHAASLGIVDDIAVLLPQKEEAVTSYGWGLLSEMLRGCGIDSEDGQNALIRLTNGSLHFQMLNAGQSGILPDSNTMLILQNLDVAGTSRAVLLLTVKKATMDSYLEKLKFGDLLSFSILQEDQAIYRFESVDYSDSPEGKAFSADIPSSVFGWSYQIQLKRAASSGFFETFAILFMALVVSCCIGALAAYLLASLSYKPIQTLVTKIGGDRQMPEFQSIASCFDRLTREKETLNNLLIQYQDAARNNMLVNLLHGYFANENIRQLLDKTHLDYDNRQYFTVVVFCCLEAGNKDCFAIYLNIKAGLMAEKASFELIENPGTAITAILSFSEPRDIQEIKRAADDLTVYIQDKTGLMLCAFCGTMEQGLIGISKSYQYAKEQSASLAFLAGQDSSAGEFRCYYPTDWELQFVNNLKLGNADPALKILKELKKENDSRNLSAARQVKLVSMIFDTVLRVMDELNIDYAESSEFFEKYVGHAGKEKQWEYLMNLTRKICSRTSYFDSGSTKETGNKILSYVDSNYFRSDLSLKELGDQMNLSVSAVSRIFKSTVKINFYDYLCRIRMDKAKELLLNTDESVAKISRRVGYENELSFKRAFLRYEGIRPKEYRQQKETKTQKSACGQE